MRVMRGRGGDIVIREMRTPAGPLRVEEFWRAVCLSEDWTAVTADVYLLDSRTAWLNGERITDPARIRELCP